MESTFLREYERPNYNISKKSSTLDRNVYAQELDDAYNSISSFKQAKVDTRLKNFWTANLDVDYCLLKKHDIFSGYTIDKPVAWKKLPNMPRDLESYASAESSHYVGRSYSRVIKMINENKWEELFDFSYHSCIEIVRELYKEMDLEETFVSADVPLFLEFGVLKGVISFPEYYEILSIAKIAEKRTVIPKYTQNYDNFWEIDHKKKYNYYHDKLLLDSKKLLTSTEENQEGKITKSDALQSLRILIDIAKNDAARHKSTIYEPFLTKIVDESIINPVVSISSKSRLLA